MNEKIYLNIYRSGHVLVSALNVCEIKSPLVHELSQYGCTRAQAEQAVRELARQDDAGWLYVAGVDVDDNDVAYIRAENFKEAVVKKLEAENGNN